MTKKELSKNIHQRIFKIFPQQRWLLAKEQYLTELIIDLKEEDKSNLILDLLEKFQYLETDTLTYYLNSLCNYIVNESGFNEDTTQILATSWDEEADSGQWVLQMLKRKLGEHGWGNVQTVNVFYKYGKFFKKGLTQVILIDEFVGSGSSVKQRLEYLKKDKNIDIDYELKCCFVAGLHSGLKLIEDMGYEIFCPLKLNKGLSDYYEGEELHQKIQLMLDIEKKLNPQINDKNIEKYSLGYNKAEALYSAQGGNGNTPNSVFPIFWWPQDAKGNTRNTILNRYEKGLK